MVNQDKEGCHACFNKGKVEGLDVCKENSEIKALDILLNCPMGVVL